MNDKMDSRGLINVIVRKEEKLTFYLEETESFRSVFPDEDMLGMMVYSRAQSFVDRLIHFIGSRSRFIDGSDRMEEVLEDFREFSILICWTEDERADVDISRLYDIYCDYCSRFDEEYTEKLEFLWQMILLEVTDFEVMLTAAVNKFQDDMDMTISEKMVLQ